MDEKKSAMMRFLGMTNQPWTEEYGAGPYGKFLEWANRRFGGGMVGKLTDFISEHIGPVTETGTYGSKKKRGKSTFTGRGIDWEQVARNREKG